MPEEATIGIQGGRGSFNEEAARRYCDENEIDHFSLKYLFTTNRVLEALNDDTIDRGFFALQNAVGGTVRETIEALSQQNCKIISEYEIIVNHCLLVQPGVEKQDVKTIISHPQALRQCKATLSQKYPDKQMKEGEGDLIDQAAAAKALAEDELPSTTAVLASKVCAELYDLEVVDIGLQDKKKNLTTFLFVTKRI